MKNIVAYSTMTLSRQELRAIGIETRNTLILKTDSRNPKFEDIKRDLMHKFVKEIRQIIPSNIDLIGCYFDYSIEFAGLDLQISAVLVRMSDNEFYHIARKA